ncbi:MAG: VanZ family protein [Opitutus sp.]|nr:VanZ family protein [Opitutus sp.]MCS6247066.1 VanZ family protein [Opitutus sp.]MCS6275203.1 VanZ family protein [Opitutus sp.]MCS6275865.1 VanZ family protein [Opitutus sp.]MCS6300961.1 VanZ family protein [Opitutus sp.]
MSSVHTPSRWQWGYALALAATVVWASSFGQVALPDCADFVNFDKLAHASVFGLMATLVLRPFRSRPIVWSIIIVSLFGAVDELHQNFTPGRSMDILDWVADTTGAVVAVSAYTFWGGYRRVLEFKLLKRKPRVSAPVYVVASVDPTARAAAPALATVAAPVVTPIPPAS